jgi:hypothetical protein
VCNSTGSTSGPYNPQNPARQGRLWLAAFCFRDKILSFKLSISFWKSNPHQTPHQQKTKFVSCELKSKQMSKIQPKKKKKTHLKTRREHRNIQLKENLC